MSQHQYLVDRFSQSLTKYDVQELFERLKEAKGNLAAATREANIRRKTVYDWENTSEDVKTFTKRKILEASFNNDLYGTIEFLVRKNAMNYHEILERYINMNCDEIISISQPQKLQRRVIAFEKFIKSHIGAIHDIRTIPIEEIVASVNKKSCSFGVKAIADDVNLISPQRLSQKFLHLLEIFDTKTMFKDEITHKLGLPREFVERACKVASYIGPSTQPVEDVTRVRILRVGLDRPLFGEYVHARKE